MTITHSATLEFETEICISCGVMFGMPSQLQKKLRDNHNSFYCPNGHSQYYSGKSDAEKLRDELKRKEQELSDTVTAKIIAQNKVDALERKLKRVHNGTCPCCKRSFKDLKRHMETKHPELVKH